MIGWIIGIGVAGGLATLIGVNWKKLQKEHEEARSLPLDKVDFSKLTDGQYRGVYEGGMYKWRANEVDVTVENGRVINVNLVSSAAGANAAKDQHELLYERVIQAQSLQVDTISMATLTSKAYLQGVENALLQAQKN